MATPQETKPDQPTPPADGAPISVTPKAITMIKLTREQQLEVIERTFHDVIGAQAGAAVHHECDLGVLDTGGERGNVESAA